MAWVTEKYPSKHYTLNSSTWYSIHDNVWEQRFLFKVTAFPSSLKHNKLIGAQLRVYTDTSDDEFLAFEVGALTASFNASNVTYYKMPPIDYWISDAWNSTTGARDRYTPESLFGTNAEAKNAHDILNAPALYIFANEDCTIKTVLSGGGTPYVHVTYSDSVKVTSKVQYKNGPKSGYSNPRNDTVFGWDYVKNGSNVWCAVESWDQTDATFYWKTSTDENYTAVSAGTAKSVTIPANTFPTASTIQWYVSGTDEDGTTTQTSVFSFSTAAGPVETSCVDPVGQVIDGSAPYTFNWTIASTDGQPASRTIFQWKQTSGDTWATLFDESSAVTSYTVPGGTFPAGSIDWQILAYNIDGTLGTYTPKTFISVAAPDAVQGLAATAVPFSTISWQSTGQEAYQITVDGKEVVKAYGPTVYSYKLEEPLADGDHTITVTVQGIYGLWSQPSEITVSIQNVPTETITLSGNFGVDASLSWDVEQDLTYIYRDGKRIGATNRQGFTDRFSLGFHEYYVLSPLPDGNYNVSDTIGGTTDVDCSQIALLSGGNWLPLEYCKELPMQTYTGNRTVTVRHYCGAVYPVAEVSTYFDKSGSFNVLFEDEDDGLVEKLESMLGELVVMKNRRNNLLVGIFSQFDKRVEDFCVDCNFIVQQTEWNDFVDETNN